MNVPAYFRLLDDRGKIPALDGLRGVAILLVVLFHAAESFIAEGEPLLPLAGVDLATPLASGWMGVNLFFVLSGFLITHHLLRGWQNGAGPRGLRVYLAKRWLRIVPTYCVVLAVAALGLVPYHEIDPNLLGLQVGYHLLFLQDYLPSSILGPFWSLGVEEKFYLVMPVVMLVLWRLTRDRSRLALFLGIAAVPLVVRLAMYLTGMGAADGEGFLQDFRNPFHLNLDALFLGAACAWIAADLRRAPGLSSPGAARAAGWLGVGIIAALMIAPWPLGERPFFHQVALFPLTAAGMALVLLAAALAPAGHGGILEGRWLARAGRIAYPWYLTHVLVLHWLGGELEALVSNPELSAGARFVLFLPPFLGASLTVALVLHFLVEKPCLILKDRIGARRAPLGTPLPADLS